MRLIRFSSGARHSTTPKRLRVSPGSRPAQQGEPMRFNARRTSLVAVAALASSFVAAGCGGGGDSADDANEVTIWSSMDPPVQAGLEKTLTAQAKEAGYTIDWQKVENINQLIMTKLQANDLPDIAFIPQPGVVADVVERGAGEPARRRARHGRARGEHGARHARGGHHRRQALRPADLHERQEPGLLPQEGLRGGGLQGSRVHRRAQRAHRADQGRRRHPVVHGHRVRQPRPAGRPPTGSRTS